MRIALKGCLARAARTKRTIKVGMLFTHVNKVGTAEECLSSLESTAARIQGSIFAVFILAPKERERKKGFSMAKVQNDTIGSLVALCKGRGFVFPRLRESTAV